MNDARLRTILMVAAVYHLLLGAFMAFAPGEFYGQRGRSHIRLALTASDAHVAMAAERIWEASGRPRN